MQRIRAFLSAKGTAGWWFYLFIRYSIRGLLYPFFRVKIVGRENLYAATPLIVAPTHRSNLDAPLLGAAPNWRSRSLSKDSLFANPVLGWVVTALGSFPVKRGAADREALRTAQQLLDQGERVLVFPEGTRQSGNQVPEIFDGTAYLASRTGAQVVPVGISGTEAAMPPGAKLPRRSKVTIVVGEPIDPPTNPDGGRVKREHLSAFTSELRATLQTLMDAAVADAESR